MAVLLKELTAARGVSGNEFEIRALLKKLSEERGAVCTVDRAGNLIAVKEGSNPQAPALLLAAHMDEVGLIVTGVRDDGLLRYAPVGGVDSRVTVSIAVECGDQKIPGIIGAKAIHLQSAADRSAVLGHDRLYVDIGAKTKDEAMGLCPPGTYITFNSPLMPLGENCVIGRALDDRVGCLNLLAALEHGYEGKLICAFTVQEETGLRGATVAGQWVKYDLAVVLEGTTCNDLGKVDVENQVCSMNQGVAISHMDHASIAHPRLRDAMEAVAVKHQIAWQPKRAVAGGNDAGALQRAAGAKPTVVLSVPCRYIHSPCSVASLSDIESQKQLVCAFMEDLPALWPSIS